MLENMIDYDIKEFVQLVIIFDSFAKLIVSGNVNEFSKILKNKADLNFSQS